jgi:hypothetical protein
MVPSSPAQETTNLQLPWLRGKSVIENEYSELSLATELVIAFVHVYAAMVVCSEEETQCALTCEAAAK